MSRKADDYITSLLDKLIEGTGSEKHRVPENIKKLFKTQQVEKKYFNCFQRLELYKDNVILLPKGGIALFYSYKKIDDSKDIDSSKDIDDSNNIVLLGNYLSKEELSDYRNKDFLYTEEGENPALFLHLLKEFPHYLKIKSGMADEILGELIKFENPKYKSDISYIISFFEDIYVFKISKESLFSKENLEKGIISLLRYLPSLLHFNNSDYLDKINKIVEYEISKDICYVDSRMMLDSVFSYYRRHAFLDIYRCLEKLFYFPEIYNLQIEINKGNKSFDILELKKICSNSISWRYTENVAIINLLKLIFLNEDSIIADQACKDFCEKFITSLRVNVEADSSDTKKIELIAKSIYMYRNSLVHHEDKEYRDSVRKLEENEWQVIADFIAESLLLFSNKFN